MTEWPTVDQVIADWAEGHGAPAERMAMHPSLPVWAADVDDEGRWTVTRDGRTVWAGMTGTVEDMVRLLEQMRRTDLPRGASRETAGVERRCGYTAAPPADHRLWRGIAYALVPSLVLWAGIIWCVWRFS